MGDPTIGTLNEGSLHAAIKNHYAQPGDRFEVPFRGYVVDIVREDGEGSLLIEVQTSAFRALGDKLDQVLEEHRVRLVHPIAAKNTLERGSKRRVSPKHGSVWNLLDELVSLPSMLDHPRLSIDVLLVDITTEQVFDSRARRRRGGWRTVDRRLDRIVELHHFADMGDLAALAGPRLPAEFTTADLAASAETSRKYAQRLAYCLSAAGLMEQVGHTRSGKVYRWSR